jgi:hypothetical protein
MLCHAHNKSALTLRESYSRLVVQCVNIIMWGTGDEGIHAMLRQKLYQKDGAVRIYASCTAGVVSSQHRASEVVFIWCKSGCKVSVALFVVIW